MSVDFYRTVAGRTYYEHTLPEIGRQLKRVADNLVVIGQQRNANEVLAAVGVLDPSDGPAEDGGPWPGVGPTSECAVVESFRRQLDTTRSGIRLKGTMDAAQLELLADVVTQHAANLAQALAKDG